MIAKEIAKEDVPNKVVPLVDAGNQRLDRLVNFRRLTLGGSPIAGHIATHREYTFSLRNPQISKSKDFRTEQPLKKYSFQESFSLLNTHWTAINNSL